MQRPSLSNILKWPGIQSALDLISATQGSILYRGASAWAALTASADRQFLSRQSAALAFAAISALDLPAGVIVQAKSVLKTDTFSTSSTSFTDVTGLSLSFAPKYSTSVIVVVGAINGGCDVANTQHYGRLVRDSTAIGVGNSAGSRRQASVQFYHGANQQNSAIAIATDTPGDTSSHTYKYQCSADGAGTVYVNRTDSDTDASYISRTASGLFVLEIAP